MRITYDIDKLKSELIGKTINWITVTDVFKDDNNHTVCKCLCKCGNTIIVPIKTINSEKIKSCGCYKHSKEFSENISNWCKNNPEKIISRTNKYKQWINDNQDKIIEHGRKHSKFFSDNPELVQKYRDRMTILNKSFNKDNSKEIRISSINKIISDNPTIADIIYKEDLDNLLLGNIISSDKIRIKCPICNEYSPHNVRDIFNISATSFKQARMCKQCFTKFTSSKYEQDILDFISTFYNGEYIKNDRTILNGKELDLYYPEKKIAIEFNGDYWHSDIYKDKMYHYNKLCECLHKNILLVSIFESLWIKEKDNIKSYLHDLFNNKENKLSFIDDYYINNNYPFPSMSYDKLSYSDISYKFKSYTVYTCGFSIINEPNLEFLMKCADENNIKYFINNNNDLEIKDMNLCFHLANIISGENDAYDRWKLYNDNNVRCVFVYPTDFKNQNKLNIYKNILLYHCKLSKRIYARNTIVKKYPAIKMKQFFEENNIAGYRNAKTAYVLEDKLTHEQYMCYLIGSAYFGKGNYDCEITRGACKLGYCIVGGASKLWKYIIEDNPDVKSIVYYCDRRQYDQRSIHHLMDSQSMSNLGTVYMLDGSKSFMNYWLKDVYISNKLWHSLGDYTNREPSKHKYVIDAINKGECISVLNPGSYTNVFVRSGYKLDGNKVVIDDNIK